VWLEMALQNADLQLNRLLAEEGSQQARTRALVDVLDLALEDLDAFRIECFDISHTAGEATQASCVVFQHHKMQSAEYRRYNIEGITGGDDYAAMRQVLMRRYSKLADAVRAGEGRWPDLVLIDGGQGQLLSAQETLAALGVTDVPLVAIAKGPDRNAGRETFFMPGRTPFKLPPRDPLLYFVERLRDEAHRFAIGSHRTRRKKDIREAGLQEIPGIGPTRKRALLHHFGTVKAIEQASLSDLSNVSGINAETAQKIYEFFHEQAAK